MKNDNVIKNLDIEQFNQDLIQLVNKYNYLPIGIIYYIMQNCLYNIKQGYQQVLDTESQQHEETQESV